MTKTEAPKLLCHDPALGLTFRQGDPSDLERSTHDIAIAAIEEGRFDDAAELAAYLIEEALEPQEIFTEWSRAIPTFMERHGVSAPYIDAETARIANLIRHPDGTAFDFETGWTTYKALVAEAIDCCKRENGTAAIAAIRRGMLHWRADHDRKCDWVCEFLAALSRRLGEDKVVDFWDEGMAIWYPNYQRFAPERQDWEISHRQLVDMAILALRGHMPGPTRRGEITYRDEGDCIALEFAPCGSGGRTLDTAPDGTSPRFEPPYRHAVVEGRHDWAWNRPGVCLYCTHCCRLGQQKAIEIMGFPARVITPPVWPRDRENSVCTWRIYKDLASIPDEAFTEVGATPPKRNAAPDADPTGSAGKE